MQASSREDNERRRREHDVNYSFKLNNFAEIESHDFPHEFTVECPAFPTRWKITIRFQRVPQAQTYTGFLSMQRTDGKARITKAGCVVTLKDTPEHVLCDRMILGMTDLCLTKQSSHYFDHILTPAHMDTLNGRALRVEVYFTVGSCHSPPDAPFDPFANK